MLRLIVVREEEHPLCDHYGEEKKRSFYEEGKEPTNYCLVLRTALVEIQVDGVTEHVEIS